MAGEGEGSEPKLVEGVIQNNLRKLKKKPENAGCNSRHRNSTWAAKISASRGATFPVALGSWWLTSTAGIRVMLWQMKQRNRLCTNLEWKWLLQGAGATCSTHLL